MNAVSECEWARPAADDLMTFPLPPSWQKWEPLTPTSRRRLDVPSPVQVTVVPKVVELKTRTPADPKVEARAPGLSAATTPASAPAPAPPVVVPGPIPVRTKSTSPTWSSTSTTTISRPHRPSSAGSPSHLQISRRSSSLRHANRPSTSPSPSQSQSSSLTATAVSSLQQARLVQISSGRAAAVVANAQPSPKRSRAPRPAPICCILEDKCEASNNTTVKSNQNPGACSPTSPALPVPPSQAPRDNRPVSASAALPHLQAQAQAQAQAPARAQLPGASATPRTRARPPPLHRRLHSPSSPSSPGPGPSPGPDPEAPSPDQDKDVPAQTSAPAPAPAPAAAPASTPSTPLPSCPPRRSSSLKKAGHRSRARSSPSVATASPLKLKVLPSMLPSSSNTPSSPPPPSSSSSPPPPSAPGTTKQHHHHTGLNAPGAIPPRTSSSNPKHASKPSSSGPDADWLAKAQVVKPAAPLATLKHTSFGPPAGSFTVAMQTPATFDPARFATQDTNVTSPRIWSDEKEQVVSGPYDYLLAQPGKDFRSQVINAFNKLLRVPDEKLAVINAVIATLHTASLLIDDVEDSSSLRRGLPVAHRIYGTPQVINSANYKYFCAQYELALLQNPKAQEIFLEELLNLHRGQGLDLYWRDTLTCPTEDDYLEMVNHKTGGLFRLGIKLMQLESDTGIDCEPLVNIFGLIFQIRDDYMNLHSTEYTENKGMCEDLTEGKFSFPVIHSIRSSPGNLQLINILGQKTSDVDVKRYAVRYMESTKSFEYTRQVIGVLVKRAHKIADDLDAGTGLAAGFKAILDKMIV